MTRRVQLPEPSPPDPYTSRLISELSRLINDLSRRVEELEALQYIEGDLARPPGYEGAWAISGGAAYIGIGGSWVQVT